MPRHLVNIMDQHDAEMVERVARAIYMVAPIGVRDWVDAPASVREDCLVCARAAIEAMREPTDAMIDAGGAATPRIAWRAMIDAALDEKPC
jgi:hypothetical protein